MPACKYPQRRNTKTGRCKKPCKKTQKVSKSTGRCVSRRRPSTRKKRRTRTPRRTCKALYNDNYIPDYIGDDIGYDTEEETPLVQKAVKKFKTLIGLGDKPVTPVTSVLEESRAESINNEEQEQPVEPGVVPVEPEVVPVEPEVVPVEPEVMPDIIPPQLSKPGVEIFKGVSSAAHSLQKNVYGLFRLQEDYNCSPSSDISQENVSSNNEDCGIVEVGMAEQDDFNDSWVKRISTQTGEIGYMTMYGKKFDSDALMWVLTHKNIKYEFFDCVFLFEKHLWRIQAKGELPLELEINMKYIATEFDRILEEGNDVEQKIFDFFYGGVDVSKIEYAGNTQVLPRKSNHVSELPFKKLALVSLTAFAATNAPDATSNPVDEPIILNDEGLVDGAEVPESVTQGLIGGNDDDTVRRPTNSDLNQPFMDGLVNNLHQGPQGMIGQNAPLNMIAPPM